MIMLLMPRCHSGIMCPQCHGDTASVRGPGGGDSVRGSVSGLSDGARGIFCSDTECEWIKSNRYHELIIAVNDNSGQNEVFISILLCLFGQNIAP